MLRRTNTFIDPRDAAYLELLIGDKDPESQKVGLQALCKFYRQGLRFRDSERLTVHLMGLLFSAAPKVVRWALNALALAGSRHNVVAIVGAIQRNKSDPDIIGAGVSALCALVSEDEARAQLAKADLPIEGAILLAAVQHSGHFQNELRVARVNIDYADPSQLRLAGVLVGLDKAPENLFSISHPNRDVIGELNYHPDPIVAQYSVWATYEHPKFSLKNLRLPLHDVPSKPANIRKYVYRLVVKDAATAQDNLDFIVMGSEDESAEARAGLASGLKDIYFDGVEEIIIDWYQDEDDDTIKQRLLEHMAGNAERCGGYEPFVLRAYEASDANSLTRARLESAARDTGIYLEMKKIAYEAEGRDLFGTRHLADPQTASAKTFAERAKVLLVTALSKEEAAVRATFDKDEMLGREGDNNLYRLGSYGIGAKARKVILASAGMGTSNAAAVTTNALRSFPDIEHIIMVGIAGGCPNLEKPDEHVRLGDVVFSASPGIIAYENVKETNAGRQTRSSLQRPSAALLQVANDLVSSDLLGVRPWETLLSAGAVKLGDKFDRPKDDTDIIHDRGAPATHPKDFDRRPGFPRIHSGAIGAADTLLKSDVKRDELRDRYGVRAVEMEASGLQTAAWSLGKDVFVVRGICDYCDEHKNDVWQNYAALAAAAYARALVEAMPEAWF